MKNTQSRKWQLTINNPLEKGCSHEEIKKSMESFSTCEYWCMCDEIGLEEHTPQSIRLIHTFLYIQQTELCSILLKIYFQPHT